MSGLDALQADGGRCADQDEIGARNARADVPLIRAEPVAMQQPVRQRDLLPQLLQLRLVRHRARDAITGGGRPTAGVAWEGVLR